MLIFVGILFIAIDLARTNDKCEKKIIYRYIPRTLEEELDSPVYLTEVLKSMFTQPSPWNASLDNNMFRKQTAYNNLFINQF